MQAEMMVLETDRMTLRWFDEGDAPFVFALVNDPAWIANIGDRHVRTLEDARVFIAEKLVASYWQKGHGLWAMERRGDRALLGMCGLIERDSLPEIDVGYALAPTFRGSGYAREAALASLRYGRDVLGKDRILAIVWPENRASIRVLESVGMVAEASRHLNGDPRPTAIFAWGAPARDPSLARDAQTEIDALVRRFFAAFSSCPTTDAVAAIPSMFLPAAVVTVIAPGTGGGIDVLNVRDFVSPRAALVQGGRLTDFEERETGSQTAIVGGVAHRSSRYRRAGRLDGIPFEGGGDKHFQIVRTARGWKIAALAWEEAAPPPSTERG
jgi:RimJ/RimL family protein N-acetyltransferase